MKNAFATKMPSPSPVRLVGKTLPALFFLSILMLGACKKDEADMVGIPEGKRPTFSFDRSMIISDGYAVGDSVKVDYTITDNGYGNMSEIRSGVDLNLEKVTFSNGKKGVKSDGSNTVDEKYLINPPSTRITYRLRYKVKDNFLKKLVSGDTLFFNVMVTFPDKKAGSSAWSDDPDNLLTPLLQVRIK